MQITRKSKQTRQYYLWKLQYRLANHSILLSLKIPDAFGRRLSCSELLYLSALLELRDPFATKPNPNKIFMKGLNGLDEWASGKDYFPVSMGSVETWSRQPIHTRGEDPRGAAPSWDHIFSYSKQRWVLGSLQRYYCKSLYKPSKVVEDVTPCGKYCHVIG